ncbi:MAG: TIGR04282 family arsenosugar biosynthesis glycosyltransferase [Chitinophagaceae bacterium]
MMQQDILIIFYKNLVRGKVKTRLAATIGVDNAFDIYKAMVEEVHFLSQKIKIDRIIYYSDHITKDDIWNNEYKKELQRGANLGEKMMNAFKDVFQMGYSKAVVIGTDCPSLTEDIINDAFNKLNNNDIVIGPAFDGGYYLLGMKILHTSLFQNIEWSTSQVLEQTTAKMNSHNLSYSLLQELHDIDEEKDLVHFKVNKT